MRRGFISSSLFAVVVSGATVTYADFASSVHEFNQGTVTFANPASQYNNPNTALGTPSRINGLSFNFPGPVSPFNPPFEEAEVVAVGVGGSITLALSAPVPVSAGQLQIGIFTTVGINDPTFSGIAQSPAVTFAGDEYGADRSAIVEVASDPSQFYSLGRVIFANPTQGFANQSTPYDMPENPVLSDFSKPFAGSLSSFDGLDSLQISALLDGSAGGNWLSVPAEANLTEILYVRISDPLWVLLSDGSTAESLPSNYVTVGDDPAVPFVKFADVFIDGVNVVPEPSAALVLLVGALGICRRRRRA